MTVQLDQKDWTNIMRKLDSLNRPGARRVPMEQSVQHFHRILARYPTKASGAFSRLATPRQKRAYWAKISSEEAQEMPGGGYRRSNTLRNRWTKDVHPDGREGKVGNNAPYAVYVQGERQQPFHAASDFPKVEDVVREEERTVFNFFKLQYQRLIRR